MNSVQHFEVPYDDQERISKFYSSVFGWKTTDVLGDTVLVDTTETDNGIPKNPGAINGDYYKRDEKLKHPLLVITVENIDEHLEKIVEAGGSVEVPKTAVADMGWCAYFKDSEGNVLGVWENAMQ